MDCAIGSGADYSNECVLERLNSKRFVIHGPNGGFRRFEIEQGEKGGAVVSIDGSTEVAIISQGDPLEFAVEDDVYRVDKALIFGANNE
ncbi:dihydroxy-acid dehydratase [Erythrobacter sp. NAP1]|uniref:hypothetical protein n=1 Tax=Erythrobacter sp. NAP1 TaxID=237727 RepID=UPI0000686EFE|nr:hypothetical protein [Erythrobacter sp. NAP1]EAQ30336.1 dihydroxy-acid dehydratase [Erythrobacter sp. NAP1]